MNEITYRTEGDYRLPNLLPPGEVQVTLGRYGLKRKKYLIENQRILYTDLLTSGKLYEHLMEIDRTAQARTELMESQMIQAQGLTEELKAADQMGWTQKMNGIRHSVEETILSDLIYA